MTTITTSVAPPKIAFGFNPYLLETTLQRMQRRVNSKILPLSLKKIRLQDIGKRKQFDGLLAKFKETYERKTAEEADYKAKIAEKIKERPCISASGGTMRFRRI